MKSSQDNYQDLPMWHKKLDYLNNYLKYEKKYETKFYLTSEYNQTFNSIVY